MCSIFLGRLNMQNIKFYLEPLKSSVYYKHISNESVGVIDRIKFFANSSSLQPNVLYIVSADDFQKIDFSKISVTSLLLFVSGKLPIKSPMINSEITLICSELSIEELYTSVSEVLNMYQQCKRYFSESSFNGIPFEKTIESFSTKFGSSCFILDTDYRVLFSSEIQNLSLANSLELLARSNPPIMSLQTLFGHLEGSEYTCHSSATENSNILFHLSRFRQDGVVKANILIVSPNNYKYDMKYVSKYLRRYISLSYPLNSNGEDRSSNKFKNTLDDILEGRLKENSLIKKAVCEGLDKSYGSHLSAMIVRFDEVGTSPSIYDLLSKKLQEVFISAKIATYGGDIVCLIPITTNFDLNIIGRSYWQQELFSSDWNMDKLKTILSDFKARACLHAITQSYGNIRTLYFLTKSSLQIGTLFDLPEKRIYFSEDYHIFNVISLAMEKFTENFNSSAYIYLVFPDIITLLRYDKLHKDNLSTVLYQYLINGMDVKKAANALFMHRNTVNNKLLKIKQILNTNFDDAMVIGKYLLSLMIVQYCERYLLIENQILHF